jgi:hypothetical protein
MERRHSLFGYCELVYGGVVHSPRQCFTGKLQQGFASELPASLHAFRSNNGIFQVFLSPPGVIHAEILVVSSHAVVSALSGSVVELCLAGAELIAQSLLYS